MLNYLEEINWGYFGEVWAVEFLMGSLLAVTVVAI
jgi:hypothetical protein